MPPTAAQTLAFLQSAIQAVKLQQLKSCAGVTLDHLIPEATLNKTNLSDICYVDPMFSMNHGYEV